MAGPEEVCVLIPTLNEAATIGAVIDGFAAQGLDRVLVVDGRSTDGTAEIARDHGADVLTQTGSGKGVAVRQGIAAVDRPYVLLVDGDGTYRPEDAPRMIDPLDQGDDHVIGNRFADMRPGAMTRLNIVGNRLINRTFALIHRRNLVDILSGYRAFSTASADEMQLTADGFGIETEMAVECVRHGIPTAVVDVTYEPRPERSATNLRPIRDGAVILSTVYTLARTNNPVFYFGSLGVLSSAIALGVGGYVLYDWLVRSVLHQVWAMVAVFGLLFGFQLITFGLLSDLIVRLYR